MKPSNNGGHPRNTTAKWDLYVSDLLLKAMMYVVFYFDTAENDPLGLGQLYRDDSQFTFLGEETQGAAEIANRLNSHPLNQYRFKVGEVDYQASSGTGGMLASFTGLVHIIGEERAHSFSRVFHLMPTPEGSCYVQNDILRVDSA